MHPTSRVPRESLDVLCRFWEQQINDFSILVKEIQDLIEGRGEKTVYLSLPRPGKHGTTSKGNRVLVSSQRAAFVSSLAGFKPTKLDSDEQSRIAKAGLEMKLITSEMDAEAEKWDEPQNEIAKVCSLTDIATHVSHDRCIARQEHVVDGVLHVSVHARRRNAAHHSGSVHASVLLRRRRHSSIGHRIRIRQSGK